MLNTLILTHIEALPEEAWREPTWAEFFAVEPQLTAEADMLTVVNLCVPSESRFALQEWLTDTATWRIGYEFAVQEFEVIQGQTVNILTVVPVSIDALSDSE